MNDLGPPENTPPVLHAAPSLAAAQPAWRWWAHLLLLGGYPIFIGTFRFGDAHVKEAAPALTGHVGGLLMVSAIQLVIFGAILGLALWASRAGKDDLLLRWRGGFWPIPLGIGYSIGIRVGMALALGAIAGVLIAARVITLDALQQFVMSNRPDVEAIVDVQALRSNPVYFWLCATVVSFVVAGLREELWRSGFLAGLKRLWPSAFGSRQGQLGAVAIAALIFGIGHLPQGGIAVALTSLIGLALGAIMVLHRSIWPAVIAHGMFDATSMALLPWAMEQIQHAK